MDLGFSRWKYTLIAVVLLLSLVYAIPNFFGEDPAVQVVAISAQQQVDESVVLKMQSALTNAQLAVKKINVVKNQALLRFSSTEDQLKAQTIIADLLGSKYSVALNLASTSPAWFESIGARPMKLGLDLRGGVRFLMEVDVRHSIKNVIEAEFNEVKIALRDHKIRYSRISFDDNSSNVLFGNKEIRAQAQEFIKKTFYNFKMQNSEQNDNYILTLTYDNVFIADINNTILEKTASTLRNRVNELGVAEAIVQPQGSDKVVVELPGIQDTTRAKDILGKTATIEFHMVDVENEISTVHPSSKVYYDKHRRPILLKRKVVLTGESIVGASSQIDGQRNEPIVAIRLGGSGLKLFKETTQANIGKPMAVVYKESKVQKQIINGKEHMLPNVVETVISVANINSALGSSFQITGFSAEQARDLALLLRSGSLPATITIVEERIIGPSMGQENIDKGILSVKVGLGLVLFFMTIYYSGFGIIANVGLVCNLLMLLAFMSIIGATLTLPGIAGIVLTLGMAVDSNVLIFERIREEIRAGSSALKSIINGFDHAFTTIVDSNLTTLIVAVILYVVGTGPVKGFAVTLSIGILTSMFTSITVVKALTNLFVVTNKQPIKIRIGI
jgi:preprotein translocase subunit SecD